MSACISSHGEYSEHELTPDGECSWCGAFDADTVRLATRAQVAREIEADIVRADDGTLNAFAMGEERAARIARGGAS